MWPFKRKDPLPPAPVPEFVPPGSVLEARIVSALKEHPDAAELMRQYPPDTLLVYLDQVGTAAGDVTIKDGHRVIVHFNMWLAYDEHHKKRGYAQTGEDALHRGITTKVTLPTAAVEQVLKCVVLYDQDNNAYSCPPLSLMDDLVKRQQETQRAK